MSGIKYLRNGEDDPIFIMCKKIDWCVEVGEDGLLWCWIGSFSEYNDFVADMNKKD